MDGDFKSVNILFSGKSSRDNVVLKSVQDFKWLSGLINISFFIVTLSRIEGVRLHLILLNATYSFGVCWVLE